MFRQLLKEIAFLLGKERPLMLAAPPDMLDEALEALEGVERAYNHMRDLAKEACEGLHTRDRRAALQKNIDEIHAHFCRAAEKAAGIAAKHGARFGGMI